MDGPKVQKLKNYYKLYKNHLVIYFVHHFKIRKKNKSTVKNLNFILKSLTKNLGLILTKNQNYSNHIINKKLPSKISMLKSNCEKSKKKQLLNTDKNIHKYVYFIK